MPYNYSDESFSLDDASYANFTERETIKVGSPLPFGPRMFYQTGDNLVRMKDIGMNRRIIVIGVLGSFTPDCWNRHFHLVLKNYDYFKERGVDHICCISTNDPYCQYAWGSYIGCTDKVLMWSDPTSKYTIALGMDVVVPWMDSNVRSDRYVILADDMFVTKMIKAPRDGSQVRWDCDHLLMTDEDEEEEGSNYEFQF